jgi:hypothetical protein
MIQILAVYSKAGSSWDAAIALVCQKRNIPHISFSDLELFCISLNKVPDPDCDIQIIYEDLLSTVYIWGWEAKATDLHASQIGSDVSFEDEIIQHLVRNQSLTRYGAIVAGPQEQHDIMMFTGMCSKHGVNWNWCGTIEKAVEKCFELVENADRVIDCRKPIYINKDKDVPTRARMLAQIHGITGDRALELYDRVKEKINNWRDFFWMCENILFDENKNSDLYRVYFDFIEDDIEPHKNRLKALNPKVKKTARKELE